MFAYIARCFFKNIYVSVFSVSYLFTMSKVCLLCSTVCLFYGHLVTILQATKTNLFLSYRLMDRSHPSILAFLVDKKLERRSREPLPAAVIKLLQVPKWIAIKNMIIVIPMNWITFLLLLLLISCCCCFVHLKIESSVGSFDSSMYVPRLVFVK